MFNPSGQGAALGGDVPPDDLGGTGGERALLNPLEGRHLVFPLPSVRRSRKSVFGGAGANDGLSRLCLSLFSIDVRINFDTFAGKVHWKAEWGSFHQT